MKAQQPPDLDPHAILAALGITGAAETTPVSGGSDTAIWRVAHGQQLYALRVFRAGQGATYRREIAAMRAAQASGLPIPAIHAAGSWHDRPALLLSWCAGKPLLGAATPALAALEPWHAVWAYAGGDPYNHVGAGRRAAAR